jgi:hypothetical protein
LLVYTDTQGLTTTIQIPSGAVTSTTILTLTQVLSPTEPISPDLRYVGHPFDLDAYRDGQQLTGFTFETTVTATFHYSDADVRGLDEKTLKLYRWVAATGWQVVGVQTGEGQKLDTINNVLTAWLRGLSRYGEMGTSYFVYLPVVIKDG